MSKWIQMLNEVLTKKSQDLARYLDANPGLEKLIETGIQRNKKLTEQKKIYNYQLEKQIEKWYENYQAVWRVRRFGCDKWTVLFNNLQSRKKEEVSEMLNKDPYMKMKIESGIERLKKTDHLETNSQHLNYHQQYVEAIEGRWEEMLRDSNQVGENLEKFRVPIKEKIPVEEFEEFPQHIKQFYNQQDNRKRDRIWSHRGNSGGVSFDSEGVRQHLPKSTTEQYQSASVQQTLEDAKGKVSAMTNIANISDTTNIDTNIDKALIKTDNTVKSDKNNQKTKKQNNVKHPSQIMQNIKIKMAENANPSFRPSRHQRLKSKIDQEVTEAGIVYDMLDLNQKNPHIINLSKMTRRLNDQIKQSTKFQSGTEKPLASIKQLELAIQETRSNNIIKPTDDQWHEELPRQEAKVIEKGKCQVVPNGEREDEPDKGKEQYAQIEKKKMKQNQKG